ncbi:MAG TPA: tryptophan--tRNA ligase, partial [Candidatus Limnocylindria bacterium]|nr:tryptophan--tRNA ligase [Candidatus Limnocylindria bacterium]
LSGEGMDALTARLSGQGYGRLKEETAEAVLAALAPIQERFGALMADKEYLSGILSRNAERAQALARRTLRKVYKKLGLFQP